MENTQVPVIDEDVFSSRPSSHRASSSRIHFPLNEPGPSSRPGLRPRPESQKQLLSGMAMTPPIRRGSPLNPQNVNSQSQSSDLRRRPSAQTPDSPRHRRNFSFSNSRSQRAAPSQLEDSHMHIHDELEMGLFSDEYDLSHEDPKIVQDVQRALKLKARREARANAEAHVSPDKSNPASSPGSSRAETPARRMTHMVIAGKTSPAPLSLPEVVSRKVSSSTSSDPDFSPAVTNFAFPTNDHPVPTSIDNGLTLDWTGPLSDDHERRWPMPIGKRKDKEKLAPLTVSVDEQERLHKAKLAKINKQASAQTRRKADITSAQLGRRYTLMSGVTESTKRPMNLAATSRWFSKQPENFKASVDKAEPFSWLKHLERRKGQTSRSRWNLSALMIEQFLRTTTTGDHLSAVSEDYMSQGSSMSSPRPPALQNGYRPPSSRSTGLTGDAVSFEPRADSKRNSAQSLQPSFDSATSSDASASSGPPVDVLSPESGNVNDIDIQDPRTYVAFGEQPRSPTRSFIESSDSNSNGNGNGNKGKNVDRLDIPELSIQIQPPSAERLVEGESSVIPLDQIPSGDSKSAAQRVGPWSPASQSFASLKTSAYNRRVRLSAPPGASKPRQTKKQREDKEELLRREYENKANILRQSTAHNHKIRQFLNKIAAALAKYESLQASQDPLPGVNQRRIPKNVLETFSHDPSAVTRATSKFRGWRAVEDIHSRILRQRDTLRTFLQADVSLEPLNKGCLLDQRIEQLFEELSQLHLQKEEVTSLAEQVEILLKNVQETHVEVKDKYNQTVSHVSTMYPELSVITALEESYRDQYQQFWDLGMDALTLLLDTVTPFWRTYGKTIGEDVRDFLIIPLYRNEFTGEPKRYRIKTMPRRSFRHWIALIVFFLASISVNILQYRAAVTSVFNARLPMIPYDGLRWTALPFFWVGIFIQWLAVVVEFAIVILECGVIAWWTGWLVNLVS